MVGEWCPLRIVINYCNLNLHLAHRNSNKNLTILINRTYLFNLQKPKSKSGKGNLKIITKRKPKHNKNEKL